MKDVLVPVIADDGLMNELSAATKLVPTPLLLGALKEADRAPEAAFLARDSAMIGRQATVGLPAMLG